MQVLLIFFFREPRCKLLQFDFNLKSPHLEVLQFRVKSIGIIHNSIRHRNGWEYSCHLRWDLPAGCRRPGDNARTRDHDVVWEELTKGVEVD